MSTKLRGKGRKLAKTNSNSDSENVNINEISFDAVKPRNQSPSSKPKSKNFIEKDETSRSPARYKSPSLRSTRSATKKVEVSQDVGNMTNNQMPSPEPVRTRTSTLILEDETDPSSFNNISNPSNQLNISSSNSKPTSPRYSLGNVNILKGNSTDFISANSSINESPRRRKSLSTLFQNPVTRSSPPKESLPGTQMSHSSSRILHIKFIHD
jgi:hypothetical protein